MTTTNIKFKNNDVECRSLGRNGYIKTKGIAYTHNGDIITIEPLRANGQVGRCSIQIPFEDLLDFAKTIAPYADQAVEEYEEPDEKDVAIGDTIEIEGKTYKCVKSHETELCENCAWFRTSSGCNCVCCGALERADGADVHFELVDTEEEECIEKEKEEEEEEDEDDNNTAKESTQIKVGEVGFLNGKKVRCRPVSDIFDLPCVCCAFFNEDCRHRPNKVPCCYYERDDRTDVYYEEVKE